MKKLVFVLMIMALSLTSVCQGAMTNSASEILLYPNRITSQESTINPLYLFANEVEGYLEGTSAVASFYLSPTDTPPGTSEGMLYADDSEGILKYYTGSGWTSLGSGTFTGGNITSDITMSNGEYIRPSITTAHATGIQVYDVDGTSWEDALKVTNGDTAAVALGDAAATLAIASSGGINVTTGGAVTGVTTLAMGGALSGVTTIAASGAATVGSIALDNGGTISNDTNTEITFGENSEDLAIDFTSDSVTLKSSTGVVALNYGDVDALSGINTIAMDAAASSLSLASDGAADDLTISVTGATNSSLVVSSSGTGADALQVTTTAGGIDITNGGASGGEDLDLLSSNASINIIARENDADAIVIATTGGGGTSESINLQNDQGTAESAIDIDASAGGIDIDAATGKNIAVTGGQFIVTSNEDVASAINLVTNTGTSETIVVTNTKGTDNAAIDLDATVGGITLTVAAAKTITAEGSITLENGQVIEGANNNQIELTENSDTLGFIFGSNKIELAACGDGVATIDFNDIDALEDIDTITLESGLVMSQPADNLFELTENSETLQLGFGTSNTIELGDGGTGVDTIDFNDVDALEDIESVTGDGTGALGGFLKTVTNDSDGKTLNVNESGTVQTNAGAGGAAAFTLPTAAAGLEYTFVVMAAQELRVTPGAGDVINYSCTAMDATEYYYADAVGETLHIIAVDATNWIVISSTGTWAEENP